MDVLYRDKRSWVIYTVLCILCPTIEGTFTYNDYLPEDNLIYGIDGCPPNTIFCLERQMCVNLDGTCLTPPTCRPDEILQTGPYGIQYCVPFEDDHYDDMQNCEQGQLYCFQTKKCVNIDGSCPAEPLCSSYQVLCNTNGNLECVDYGSCSYAEGFISLRDADLETLIGADFSNARQFSEHFKSLLAGQLQTTVSNIWSIRYETDPVGIHFSINSELYDKLMELIMTSKVQFVTDLNGNQLNIDWVQAYGFNHDMWNTVDQANYDGTIQQCGYGQVYCFQRGECVNIDGTCSTEPVCYPHQTLCEIYGKLTCVDGESCIYDKDTYETCKDDTCIQCFIHEIVDWSTMTCVPYKIDNGGVMHQCNHGELYCFETGSCVTPNGQCPLPECDGPTTVCYTGSTFECSEYCEYASFKVDLNANFFEVVGSYYERYDMVKSALLGQMAGALGVSEDMFIDSYIWNGSLIFWGRLPVELYDKLHTLLMVEESLSLSLDGKILDMMQAVVYKETFDGMNGWLDHGDNSGDPDMQCPDNQIVDWSTMTCVPYNNHYDDMQNCEQGQLYCFQTKRCVNIDGSCPAEPLCSSHQVLCNTNGNLECVDYGSCSYAEGFISLRDADLETLIGADFSNAGQFSEHFKSLLAEQLQTTVSYIWSIRYATDPVGIHFSIKSELYDKLMELIMTSKVQFATDLNGNQLNIDWVQAYGYNHDMWNAVDQANYDGTIQQCGYGQLFCFQTLQCVNMEKKCVDDVQCLSPDEEPCPDGNGSFICVRPEICTGYQEDIYVKATGQLILDADFDVHVSKDDGVTAIQDLKLAISKIANIDHVHILNIMLTRGSIIADITFFADPKLLNATFNAIQAHTNNVGTITLGETMVPITSFTIIKDDHDSGDSHTVPDPDEGYMYCPNDQLLCLETNECVSKDIRPEPCVPEGPTCMDMETHCQNLDKELTVTCVPKDICHLGAVCPLPEKDSVSACVIECDPKIDTENADGEMCCPMACGGAMYILPVESYICPRNMTTGMCLTPDDIQCELGKEWCASTFTCETTETCVNSGEPSIDETPDRFIARLRMSTEWQDSLAIIKTLETETSFFKEALIEFQRTLYEALVQALTNPEIPITVESVSVYPETNDLHDLSVYVDIVSAKAGTITAADIKGTLDSLTFTSSYFKQIIHTLGEETTVTLFSDDTKRHVYFRTEPVIAGIDSTLDLQSVLPAEMFTSTPVQASIDCSGESVEINIDGTPSIATVVSDTSSMLRHMHNGIAVAKCKISSNQFKDSLADVSVFIGLILLPKPIGKLGALANLQLNESITIETEEDSVDCNALPDNLITVKSEGDAVYEILNNWPALMSGSDETWYCYGTIPLARVFQSVVQNYQMTRSKVKRNLRVTVSVDPPTAAKISYKGESLRKTDPVDILATIGNLQRMQICIAADFSGEINLNLTQVLSDTTNGISVQIPIQVTAVNDAPSVIARDFSQAMEEFVHAAVLEDRTDDESMSSFIVSDIISTLFTDDESETLGIALIGPITSIVDGQWQFSRDGSIWTDITQVTVPEIDQTTVDVILLNPTDQIRFSTQNIHSWKMNEAPKISFLAWDGSNKDSVTPELTDTLTLTKCHTLEKEMRQYCRKEGNNAYSHEIVVLSLARRGCDDVVNSQKEILTCGCGDDTSCYDCNHVPHGTDEFDACGVCGGNNTDIDCNVAACRQNNTDLCDRIVDLQDMVDNMCEDGQELISPEYSQYCDKRCITTGDDVKTVCDLPCDIFECLDCAGEVGKNEFNLCGVCQPIETLNAGCETIGNILPRLSNTVESINITIDVAPTLLQSDTPVIACSMEQKDPAIPGVQVPEITNTKLIPATTSTSPKLACTLQISNEVDALPALGEFAVTCTIDGTSVSTADASQYLLLYENPRLTSVSPEHSLIKDVSYATVQGEGIFDTGYLYCMTTCFNSDEVCEPKMATGERLSDTEAVCPMSELISRRLGRTYNLFVFIDDPRNIDISSLTDANRVPFAALMPAPTIVSADLNTDECSMVTVEFDVKVTSASSEGCAYFFASPSFESDVKCVLLPGSRKLFIENDQSNIANEELRFNDNIIQNAAETNTDTNIVNYVSGTIMIQGEESPVVYIDGRIPDKVGCTGVTLMPIIKNKGCWDIQISWTVTADGADITLLSNLQSEIGQHKIFKLSGGQLEDGVEYIFTMSWQAGTISGEDTITLTKDSASSSSVVVYGVETEHDVSETIDVKANIIPCDPNDANIGISWSLTPAVAQLEYTDRTFTRIQAGSLQYQSNYELSYTVNFGNGEVISGKVTFKTRARPVKAGIRHGDDISFQPRELKQNDDLTLACVNLEDSTDQSDYTCTWTCMTNFLGYDEDDMLPCFEFKDSEYIQLEKVGHSILLEGTARLLPPRNFNLREEWTVVMARDGHTSVSKGKTFVFKQVPVELSAPEIRRRLAETDVYTVTDTISTLVIDAGVRKATRYEWSVATDDDTAVFPYDVFSGETDKDVPYSEKYIYCGIDLDFTNFGGETLKAGELYAVTLTAYNQQDDVYLSISEQFLIQYIPMPQQGSVTVIPDEETIKAWDTSLTASFLGWSEVTDSSEENNLRCNAYYTNTQDSAAANPNRLNTLPFSPTETFNFKLPEGEIKIEVSCCNSYDMCATAEADGTLTVQGTDSTGIITVIESDLTLMTTLESDMILRFVKGLKSVVETVISDAVEAEKVTDLLREAMQQSIFTAFAKSSDKRSKLAVIEQVAEVVTPGDLDEDSKTKLQQEASDFVKEATGQTPSKRRRRRSTEVTLTSSGLTIEEAIPILQVFDSTISEATMTADDAIIFKETIDDVMRGLCQAYTGSTPWLAPAQLSHVRVHRTTLAGLATTEMDVSCTSCDEVDYPAKVTYGSDLEAMFNDTWDCVVYAECFDVCIASAQVAVDTISLTTGAIAPTRMSDIIMLKIINPESFEVEAITNLNSPIEATLTLNGTVDFETYEYKCFMWVSDDWSDEPCTTTLMLTFTSMYEATCTCNALGIISVFQELKPEDIITTTTTSLPTSSPTTVSVPVQTASPTVASKDIEAGTDYVLIEFMFTDDFATSVGSSETDLKNKIKQDLSAQTGYSTNSFRNLQIAPGSIIVTFELHTAESGDTLGQMVYKIEDMLNTATITFSSTTGTPLNLKPYSFIYEEVDEDANEEKESESSNLLIIIGAALGGLVIICVTVIIVLLVIKNKKQRTYPAAMDNNTRPPPRYNTPPPTYAIAPPPPYMYQDPPVVNEWMENELHGGKKRPIDEKRPSTNGSDGSGCSMERRMQDKIRNSGPTPVAD